ncbi:hypothetical protein O1W69_04670 [Chlamydia sp. 12-01]|uniref:CT214 family putative inclusion membrane protein n=1 Tax=Chlamydia sp. 12-01 TaxID=3002742 RepID=UPI0035D5273D
MSQPTISPNLCANNPTDETVEVGFIVPKEKDTACKIRQSQIISLVSALVAAALLLTILILQIIPGVPLAFSIILGLALSVSAVVSLVSFAIYFLKIRKVVFELAEASTELRDVFANFSLDLVRSIEPQRITRPPKYGLRTRPKVPGVVSTQISSPTPQQTPTPTPAPVSTPISTIVSIPDPTTQPVSLPEEKPTETPTQVSGEELQVPPEILSPVEGEPSVSIPVAEPEDMNVDDLFQRNLLKLVHLSEMGGSHPTVDKHPDYKKEHRKVAKAFSTFCQGISEMWEKLRRGEMPISAAEMLTMFTLPIFGADSHSVLRITCNGKSVFSNECWGAFWLHDALNEPKHSEKLLGIISVLKKSNQSIKEPKNRQTAYTAALVSLNVLLSGWCLCNPNLTTYILGSVQALPVSSEKKTIIIEMLNSGNILGSLIFLHGDTNPAMQDVMRLYNLDPEGKILPGPQGITDILFESIDPYNVRSITVKGDLSKTDQLQDDDLMKAFQRILEQLGDSLPTTVAGLGYDINKGTNERLNESYSTARKFLTDHPPASTSMIFCFLQAIRGAPKLQSRAKNYLPYAGKEAIGALLSTLILGGYSLGLFTYKQIDGLRQTLGISERELIRLIQSRKIAGVILPKLL